MIPFKGREIDHSKKVEIYRNLNRSDYLFSVRQNGLVVAHTNTIYLKDCDYIINPSGKKKVLEDNKRNVHAYVKGYVYDGVFSMNSFIMQITYNPFVDDGFKTNDGEIVHQSQGFFITNKMCFIVNEK